MFKLKRSLAISKLAVAGNESVPSFEILCLSSCFVWLIQKILCKLKNKTWISYSKQE